MQTVGFTADFILFVIPAFKYDYYVEPAHVHTFQAMYFLSSFFNQFGPNSITFICAAEVYPTPIRATAHGFSAAVGKLGALTATLINNYSKTTKDVFHVVPWFGLAGALLTFFFMPDTTGLDLKEQERRWKFIRDGREHEYHGIAIHPKHLSFFETFVLRKNKPYDPQLDYQQKVEEIRAEWLERERAKAAEKEGRDADYDWEHDEWSEELDSYFSRTSGHSPAIEAKEKPPMVMEQNGEAVAE
jgi:hypothetical protein